VRECLWQISRGDGVNNQAFNSMHTEKSDRRAKYHVIICWKHVTNRGNSKRLKIALFINVSESDVKK